MVVPPLRALLIDDEEVFSILLRRMLRNIPGKTYEVEWASSYEAGLEAMRQHRHDVYLLDHDLGARTGLDLLAEVGTLGLRAPVIMLTGTKSVKTAVDAMKLGRLVVLDAALRYQQSGLHKCPGLCRQQFDGTRAQRPVAGVVAEERNNR